MTERRKKGCNEIGFVDPHIVFEDPITPKTNWKSESESNLMNFLVNQRHKKDILFPYTTLFRSVDFAEFHQLCHLTSLDKVIISCYCP